MSKKADLREALSLANSRIDQLDGEISRFGSAQQTFLREAAQTLAQQWQFEQTFSQPNINQGVIDTSGSVQQNAQKELLQAFDKNGFAATLVDFYSVYPMGTGLTWQIPWDDVSDRIKAFWKRNDLDLIQYRLALELSLFGDLFVRFAARENPDKSVDIDFYSIDPSTIVFIATHPENTNQVMYYHQRYFAAIPPDVLLPPDGSIPDAEWIKQVDGYDNVIEFEPTTEDGRPFTSAKVSGVWGYDGGIKNYDPNQGFYAWITRRIESQEVIHRKVNNIGWEKRGRSDLHRVLPWLKEYQIWLQTMARAGKVQMSYVYDVTVDGGPNEINAVKMENASPPLPGSIKIHGPREVWNAVSPNLNLTDFTEIGTSLLRTIAVGTKTAAFMLGDGQTNFATSDAQLMPVIKSFTLRKSVLENLFTKIFSRVVQIHQALGDLDETYPVLDHNGDDTGETMNPKDSDFSIRLPEVADTDMLEKATALGQLHDRGLVSDQETQDQFGLDPEEMKEEMTGEQDHKVDTQIQTAKKMESAGLVPPSTPDGAPTSKPPVPPAANIVRKSGGVAPNPAKKGGKGRAYPDHQKVSDTSKPRRGN